MNFLMARTNSRIAAEEQQSAKNTQGDQDYATKAAMTLEGLISEDPLPKGKLSEPSGAESNQLGDGDGDGNADTSSGNNFNEVESHKDVADDDGFIVIPSKEVPENWEEAPDILSLRSQDRSFVFPGEQIRILACLSAYKQDTEVITPFKIAALMNKNGMGPKKSNGNSDALVHPESQTVTGLSEEDDGNGGIKKEVSTGESLLRMEDHKRQTEELLERFQNSHFFARIAKLDEPLWSKRKAKEVPSESSKTFEETLNGNSAENVSDVKRKNSSSSTIDRGHFDARTSGGLARGAIKCCSLRNGDIVVLLQVNVGVEFVSDPILEILQFEKYRESKTTIDNQDIQTSMSQDPSDELLKWLLPLDNSIPSPARPLSPPKLGPSSSIRSTSSKHSASASSGSQLFSFGNFRSYSMSSIPSNVTPPPAVTTPDAKPAFDPEDWNQFSFKKSVERGISGNEGLLSFRGVPLVQERFSVQCGLEGIFTPGRRWRRKIELVQPLEIHSFSVDCNTDDLLCVHVKNVSPAHTPDIVVFVDAITIVFEEASKSGQPLSLPIACIEAGDEYSLPNLALRRGEEHSFIVKPTNTLWRQSKATTDGNARMSRVTAAKASSSWHQPFAEGKYNGSTTDRYAVVVSCRCNYAESKLFFKQPTSWRPRVPRDLMISVTSETSRQSLGTVGTELPVQVLTLQASNMTSENLTLTVLAPSSFSTPPSVVSLSASPSSPLSPFGSGELVERTQSDNQRGIAHGLNSIDINEGRKVEDGGQLISTNDLASRLSDAVPCSDLGRTHLWLQSKVPLGLVPSHSTATIKLEVLPLTDGIITLDSLHIDVKEKGHRYVPEHSLKIYAASGIATGIV